ncbi:bifunctional diguanylate cyclase/phosphodiesterase [Lysobacter bugurensis]|uniref:Bifunctional diguanylate cyclase/phosphodiesterase n=1 Tax=Cognatilysobacter bugurensis TaxID=543356 RepID=A0A918SVA9_9GAMM|nr:bifunctional diguanylate cyclase/phosphodiesterase [Lysobacter bugurensis]
MSTLLDASGLEELAHRLVACAPLLGWTAAAAAWRTSGAGGQTRELDVSERGIAREARGLDGAARSRDGSRTAIHVRSGERHHGFTLVVGEVGGAEAWSVVESMLPAIVRSVASRERLAESVRQLERSEQLQSALFTIADMAGSDMDMPDMLRGMHAIVGRFMYAENFYIALHEPELDALRFLYLIDTVDPIRRDADRPVPMAEMEHGLTWYLVRDGQPLMGSIDQIRAQISGPMRDIGTQCYDWLGVPISSGARVRGVLVVQSYIERPRYTHADQALLSYVGSHILTALDRKRAQEDLERRVEERTLELQLEIQERQQTQRLQDTLYRIAELSNTATDLDAFYASVHRVVGEFMDAKNFYIALLDESGESLHFPYFVDEHNGTPAPRRLGAGITEYVLRYGKPMLVDMTQTETRQRIAELTARGELAVMGALSLAWLGVPLVSQGRTLGALAVQSYTPGVGYSTRDQELLTFISYQIANGLDRQRGAASLKRAYAELEHRVDERTRELSEQIAVRQRIEERLKHEALHDSLTGLPNRAYLRDHLLRCLARMQRDPNYRFAVLFMDLDRFKVINDSAGHLVGDELLREVARRFGRCVRAGEDIVARLGGDEFAILIEGISGHDDALRMASRVINALREPIRIDDKELFTGASVGIALSSPHYQTPEELLRDADIAMYRAKAADLTHVEVFDEKLHQEALRLLDLESELRRAIPRKEFEPYFQPIVCLRDGHVVGYEALLRWNHPERGVLAPGAFLQVAEASGSLEAIDWQMFESTFNVVPELLEPGQYVNLNFSPRHFRNADLDTRLLGLLARHGVRPEQVRIEVTEGTLMENSERVARVFERLRANGIFAALDDFGTGYSSLSYLHRFPLQTVKIDRSFIIDLAPGESGGSTAVVRAILALSRSQSLEVVAEGVETDEQRRLLLDLGCELGQGYFFAKPKSLAQIIESRQAH